jgi:orotate phosphoribosyltransferase
MNLFQSGFYTLHSGRISTFKIDCDALTDDDINTIALLLAQRLPAFKTVEGVPSGGLRLAEAMSKYATQKTFFGVPKLLIVDDVFTTGSSMEKHRGGREATGAVIFARGETPNWITPLFSMM